MGVMAHQRTLKNLFVLTSDKVIFMEQNEIILSCNYKELKIGKHYVFEGSPDGKVFSGVLSALSDEIEQKAFEWSGIDTKKIDEIVSKCGGIGIRGVISGLMNIKRSDLLPGAKNERGMVPIAESYFLNKLFKKCIVGIRPEPNTSCKFTKEDPSNVIFIGNIKPWFAVRKIVVDNKTQAYEVSGTLSAINFTITNKSFEFLNLGSDSDIFSCGTGARKSFSALADAFKQLEEKLKVCKYDSTYVAYACLQTCANVGFKKGVPGYMPYANAYVMEDKYPDLKIKKPKGRMAKG